MRLHVLVLDRGSCGSCIACISSRFADCAQGEYTLEHTDIHLQYKRETEQPSPPPPKNPCRHEGPNAMDFLVIPHSRGGSTKAGSRATYGLVKCRSRAPLAIRRLCLLCRPPNPVEGCADSDCGS
jgi:hypothetical protein